MRAMLKMTQYYLSRALISAAFGGLFAITGTPWWIAALTGAGIFALFLWAPRSGRYAVHPERGVTALQRDERTQGITDKAGKNAFVVMGFAVAGLTLYFGSTSLSAVPVRFLSWTLILGVITYFASDLWLRRT